LFNFRKILLIRPKIALADDENYRERRHFTPWTKLKQVEDFTLPPFIQEIIKQVNLHPEISKKTYFN
jgi:NAD+ synthase (glutamine-hydrolysing)